MQERRFHWIVVITLTALAVGRQSPLRAAEADLVGPLSIPPSLGLDFWNDPRFVREFLGSYGVRSEVEPEISSDERGLLKRVRDHLPTNPGRAAQELSRARDSSSSAALDFVLGNLRLQRGDIDAAVRHFGDALDKFPDFLRAHKNLGIALVRSGDFGDATKHLTRAIELGAGGAQVYGLLGYCHLSRDKLASAETAYRNASLMAPDNSDWAMGLAKTLLGQGKYQDAEALFEELITHEPKNPQHWLHQANAYIALDQPMEAAVNYEMIRLYDELSADATANLGSIYLQQGMRDRALDTYLALIDRGAGKQVDHLLQAAELLRKEGNWDRAGKLVDQLQAKLGPELSGTARQRLDRLRAARAKAEGKTDEAVRIWQTILDKHPLDGHVLIQLADHHVQAGAREKAELLYERAARLDDFRVPAWLRHAEMLVGEQQYKQAVKLLEKAQQADPQERIQRYLKQVKRLADG